MKFKFRDNKGFALITALMIIVIMIIMSTALIATSVHTVFMVDSYAVRKRAISLAECGVQEAIANLLADKTWSGELPGTSTPEPLKNLSEGEYYVTFDSSSGKLYSVNNLTSPTSTMGYEGRVIPPYSANIICVATIRGVSRVVDIFIQPGSDTDSPLLVDKDISIDMVDPGMTLNNTGNGILNILSQSSGNADIHSNTDINIDGNLSLNGQKLSASGTITTTGNSSGGSVVTNSSNIPIPPTPDPVELACITSDPIYLPAGTYTKVDDNTYSFTDQNTNGATVSTGTYEGLTIENGKMVIEGNIIIEGKTTIEGDVKLNGGSYIQVNNNPYYESQGLTEEDGAGTLDISGNILGYGSVITARDISFDVTRPANPPDTKDKVSIFAGGNVTMKSVSDNPAEFSGVIHGGKVTATDIKTSSGDKKDLTLYGGVFVTQNELPPVNNGAGFRIGPAGTPEITPTPDLLPTPDLFPTFPPICFLPDTIINTEKGEKKIQEVTLDDTLISYNNNKVVKSKIEKLLVNKTNTYIELKTEHSSVKATPEHPFYRGDDKYIPIEQLNVGDYIYILDKENFIKDKIISKEIVNLSNPITVYNFELYNTSPHNYFANKYLVHNSCGEPDPTVIPTPTIGELSIPPLTPDPIITDGNININAQNVNIIYDEDYLNVINSKGGYTNYNISSWREYSK